MRDDGWEGEIIVLTAHKSFDYARWALEVRAAQYLLKPVDSTRLLNLLHQSCVALEQRSLIHSQDPVTVGKLAGRFSSIAEDQFFRDVLLPRSGSATTIERYRLLLDLPLIRGVCFSVYGEGATGLDDRITKALRRRVWTQSERMLTKAVGHSVVCIAFSERAIGELFESAETGAETGARFLIRLTNEPHHPFVGGTFGDIESLFEAFEACIRFVPKAREAPREKGYFRMEKNLREALLDCRLDIATKTIHALLEQWLVDTDPETTSYEMELHAAHYMRTVFGTVQHYVYEQLGSHATVIDLTPFERATEHPSFEAVTEACLQCAFTAVERLQGLSEPPSHRTVRLAKEHIASNYHRALTLESVASEVGVSAPYLSKLFNRVDGGTFKDHLTRTRVYQARRLLAEGGYSIDTVAQRVGYSDGSALHKAFRRITGLGPQSNAQLQSD